ncbi:SDR family NAD(P)-dependent oxidoreductase [Streptomyces sp. WELS2]|uniref:SDR family NAD(P)-dependent oxidoreductase n=1 Tax=Streptomyces sp. WELS2 TaxID=2749435 RepID=UPI0028681474|nr:SDR family NAD(P)-dependent oxidoreductase [Streptomyces sp. WELS2]
MDHWTADDIPDQTGRTALITGGNGGNGLESARALARHGARVILAGRSQTKLDQAAEAVRAATHEARTDTLVLDLSDLSSVRDAATRIAETETVDLLFNNAGVINLPERRTTHDGFEMTVGTNHLGHFAFDAQVWPAVRRSSAPRVVTVSAIAARWPIGRLDDLMSEEGYRAMGAYAKSKRANIVYTLELARRTASSPVEALVVHPGSAMTGLQRHGNGALSRVVTPIAARLLMGSAEGAAWPSLYAATSPYVQWGQFIGPAGRDQTSGAPQARQTPRRRRRPRGGQAAVGNEPAAHRCPLRPRRRGRHPDGRLRGQGPTALLIPTALEVARWPT